VLIYPKKWHRVLPRRHPDSTTPCAPQCEQKCVCFFAFESLALVPDLPRLLFKICHHQFTKCERLESTVTDCNRL
jgi:hypothetical protein